jgi:hypothetical protein
VGWWARPRRRDANLGEWAWRIFATIEQSELGKQSHQHSATIGKKARGSVRETDIIGNDRGSGMLYSKLIVACWACLHEQTPKGTTSGLQKFGGTWNLGSMFHRSLRSCSSTGLIGGIVTSGREDKRGCRHPTLCPKGH